MSEDHRNRIPLPFFMQKPPGSAATVAAWLDAKCEEFSRERGRPVFGIYPSIATISQQVGFAERTVSSTALKWLVKKGWIEPQEFRSGGTIRTMWWCKWRFPAQAGANLDPLPAHEGARNTALRGARFSAPKQKSELIQEEKTTTDGGMSLFFVQEGDEERRPPDLEPEPIAEAQVEPTQSGLNPDSIPPQSIALPAELVEKLEAATDRPAVRSKLKAEAEAWLARDIEPLWIKFAILEFATKIRIKDDPKPIIVPVKWFRGMLETWVEKGEATPVLARAALVAEQKLARQREADLQALEAKQAREAETRSSTDRDAALKSRWEGLTEEEREAIRAKVRADNPAMARLKPMIEALCLAEVERRSQP